MVVNVHRVCDEQLMPRGRLKQFDVAKLLKLTAAQYASIQAYAAQHGLTDSDAMRQLIELGLVADEPVATPSTPPSKRRRPTSG